jgi:hypothetical protein
MNDTERLKLKKIYFDIKSIRKLINKDFNNNPQISIGLKYNDCIQNLEDLTGEDFSNNKLSYADLHFVSGFSDGSEYCSAQSLY